MKNKAYYLKAEKILKKLIYAEKWNINRIMKVNSICIDGQKIGYLQQAKN
jgi:hypothetical protein